MMNNRVFFAGLAIWSSLFLLNSCVVFRKAESDHLHDGYYRTVIAGKTQTVWVETGEDTLRVEIPDGVNQANTEPIVQVLNLDIDTPAAPMRFVQRTLDVDLLSIPVKIRPATQGIPTQMVTSINAAIFLGFRKDVYHLHQQKQGRGHYRFKEFHHGFSIGACTGIGASSITSGFTRKMVSTDYEGVVWSNGIAGLIAINQFTIGVMLGTDNLLNTDRRYWIYEGKPWVGLAVGLNLN